MASKKAPKKKKETAKQRKKKARQRKKAADKAAADAAADYDQAVADAAADLDQAAADAATDLDQAAADPVAADLDQAADDAAADLDQAAADPAAADLDQAAADAATDQAAAAPIAQSKRTLRRRQARQRRKAAEQAAADQATAAAALSALMENHPEADAAATESKTQNVMEGHSEDQEAKNNDDYNDSGSNVTTMDSLEEAKISMKKSDASTSSEPPAVEGEKNSESSPLQELDPEAAKEPAVSESIAEDLKSAKKPTEISVTPTSSVCKNDQKPEVEDTESSKKEDTNILKASNVVEDTESSANSDQTGTDAMESSIDINARTEVAEASSDRNKSSEKIADSTMKWKDHRSLVSDSDVTGVPFGEENKHENLTCHGNDTGVSKEKGYGMMEKSLEIDKGKKVESSEDTINSEVSSEDKKNSESSSLQELDPEVAKEAAVSESASEDQKSTDDPVEILVTPTSSVCSTDQIPEVEDTESSKKEDTIIPKASNVVEDTESSAKKEDITIPKDSKVVEDTDLSADICQSGNDAMECSIDVNVKTEVVEVSSDRYKASEENAELAKERKDESLASDSDVTGIASSGDETAVSREKDSAGMMEKSSKVNKGKQVVGSEELSSEAEKNESFSEDKTSLVDTSQGLKSATEVPQVSYEEGEVSGSSTLLDLIRLDNRNAFSDEMADAMVKEKKDESLEGGVETSAGTSKAVDKASADESSEAAAMVSTEGEGPEEGSVEGGTMMNPPEEQSMEATGEVLGSSSTNACGDSDTLGEMEATPESGAAPHSGCGACRIQ